MALHDPTPEDGARVDGLLLIESEGPGRTFVPPLFQTSSMFADRQHSKFALLSARSPSLSAVLGSSLVVSLGASRALCRSSVPLVGSIVYRVLIFRFSRPSSFSEYSMPTDLNAGARRRI